MSDRLVDRRRRTPRPAGGWIITYADLMTILVCFFVLIVSYSIQDKVKLEVVAGSMRDAFGVAEERRYAGDVKMVGAPEQRQPGNVRPTPTPSGAGLDKALSAKPAAGADGFRGGHARADAEKRRFAEIKTSLERALLKDPLLRHAAPQVTVSLAENGFAVVLVDSAGAPMFDRGGAEPTPRAAALLAEIARALAPLPNRIFIDGHADATGGPGHSTFDLTAARANAARRALEAAGFPSARIAGVAGRGAAAPLFPENPYADGNRRIEIRLEPAAPLTPEDKPF